MVKTACLISTYNWPWALERVLTGLARQTTLDFEVVIGDDGSGPETRAMIERFAQSAPFRIEHVWHEDLGRRKTRAMNNAIRATDAEHLIFLDQDGIPAANLVELHRACYAPNRLIVGGYVRLTRDQTEAMTLEDVRSGAFESLMTPERLRFLRRRHLKNQFYILTGRKSRPKLMGLNFSIARDLIEKVNGFDEAYVGWGQEDSDLRHRVRFAGGGARCIWHKAFVFHLWHPEDPTKGKQLNRQTYEDLKRGRRPWRCAKGLVQEEPAA
ncbi:MAG: glycosyltransferase [Planctomycetota bacterium]|nr:MAG: glycosyltransferase [Planctomycetota bacterium]